MFSLLCDNKKFDFNFSSVLYLGSDSKEEREEKKIISQRMFNILLARVFYNSRIVLFNDWFVRKFDYKSN